MMKKKRFRGNFQGKMLVSVQDTQRDCNVNILQIIEIANALTEENEQLKQTEKDCQKLNHKLIIKNDELEQEIRKFKRIIDKLEVERCEYLNDKQAKSKWGDNYD